MDPHDRRETNSSHFAPENGRQRNTIIVSGQISSRPHTTDFPQMVVNCKGNPLISGKPRLVKYYNLPRIIVSFWDGLFLGANC